MNSSRYNYRPATVPLQYRYRPITVPSPLPSLYHHRPITFWVMVFNTQKKVYNTQKLLPELSFF
jgi:hypothetical protein